MTSQEVIHRLLTVTDTAFQGAIQRINRRQKRERPYKKVSYEQELEKRSASE